MFVILAERRSGTHMLASLLDSHPNLRCYDEVLLPNSLGLRLGWKDMTQLEENEGCIVTYRAFLQANLPIRNIVCKSNVIHLIRDNLDNQVESIERMSKNYNPNNLEWRKNEILRLRSAIFGGKYYFPKLFNIYYEDICHDNNIQEYTNDKLLAFLGVKPAKLVTQIKKGEK